MSIPSSFDLENDDGLRRLLYFGAFLLFFMPYFQGLAGLWPLRFGTVQWRFQAAGVMSGILMQPFLGLLLALAVARNTGNKTLSKVIGGVGLLTALVLVVAIGLFVLDALQLKTIVQDAQLLQFKKVMTSALMTMLMALVAFSVLGIIALRAPKGAVKVAPKGTRRPIAEEPPGLLIGQNYTKPE